MWLKKSNTIGWIYEGVFANVEEKVHQTLKYILS